MGIGRVHAYGLLIVSLLFIPLLSDNDDTLFSAKKIYEIGRDVNNDPQLFGDIIGIASDSEGRVYVGDGQSLSIKVFDRDGKFLREIGGPGRGPGEFQYLDVIGTVGPSRVLVVDFLQRRATYFSGEGEVLDTHTSTSLADKSVRGEIHELPSGNRFLVLNKHDRRLFHLYKKDSLDHITSFGEASLSGLDGSRFMDRFTVNQPGFFCVDASGGILYVPPIYDEKIYRFERLEERWSLVDTLKGQVESDVHAAGEPYRTSDRPDDVMYISAGGWEDYSARNINHWSLGIFPFEENRIIHFSYVDSPDEPFVQAELFDQDGELLAYGSVENMSFPDWSEPIPPIFFEAKGLQRRFYVRGLREFDTLGAFRIDVRNQSD
jgi:hypothetical protein